ncbi:potassium/proton antiporter [Thioalkalivibrio sp. HL-Eb18]|uniref:potassium/proton antiporter n=1 Tax=Thioalkalivibrio sp. HL-Eb18 TaxID=1266913 RepID=UPI0003799F74|nr:potassium/proton antiporter [Thioalkalivibrio sp. HL-Eb18]
MDWIFPLIFIGAGLIVVSVLTSVLSFRLGAPLLLVFLGIGLLAGEDGLGLEFDDPNTAFLIGSLALAVILFDSGFGTRLRTLRRAAGPAIVLATVGVALTTLLLGVAAHWLLDLPWAYALLLGALISSTDAAAVFFLLRVGGVKINRRVRSILEVESGSNDPMAIFLTVVFIEWILSGTTVGGLATLFATEFLWQMGLGLLLGVVGGYLLVELVNRLPLEEGLYPIAVMAGAVTLFALAGWLGGSGFLAAYVAGIVAGNRKLRGAAKLHRQQQGLTWLAQISMFLILGLLATPSEFPSLALPALALGLVLILVARPLAVWLCLLPFRQDWRSTAFVSWVGLRGAVSILLAILPMVAGIEGGELFFNIVFMMVLVSLLVQGWTIRPVAERLGLVVPPEIGPVERVQLELPGSPRHELAVYRVIEDSPVLRGARLPRWARPSLVVREGRSVRYQQAGHLTPGDYVYIFVVPEHVPLLDRLFASPRIPGHEDPEFFGELPLHPEKRLAELCEIYGVSCDAVDQQLTIGAYLEQELPGDPIVGDRVSFGAADLIVREVDDLGRVTQAGLAFMRHGAGGDGLTLPWYGWWRALRGRRARDRNR